MLGYVESTGRDAVIGSMAPVRQAASGDCSEQTYMSFSPRQLLSLGLFDDAARRAFANGAALKVATRTDVCLELKPEPSASDTSLREIPQAGLAA